MPVASPKRGGAHRGVAYGQDANRPRGAARGQPRRLLHDGSVEVTTGPIMPWWEIKMRRGSDGTDDDEINDHRA
ncbi:hypothetical protein B296_00013315 [Ensete ventricosum]|uniref:Uncharacterized protein n=1 Tax=Ensete ventricosum TaxID=4639 RepID=A0A426X908_ENSVE|nr:hypothetical protein B296_00013315 [Ensete ventricosum]